MIGLRPGLAWPVNNRTDAFGQLPGQPVLKIRPVSFQEKFRAERPQYKGKRYKYDETPCKRSKEFNGVELQLSVKREGGKQGRKHKAHDAERNLSVPREDSCGCIEVLGTRGQFENNR